MTKAASQPSAGELEERGILSPVHTPEPAPRETETPARARRHRVSCLINHYNYGAYVEEAVASVLAQTHAVDEVVLVDDGSDPDHLEAARREAASSRSWAWSWTRLSLLMFPRFPGSFQNHSKPRFSCLISCGCIYYHSLRNIAIPVQGP